MKEKNEHIPQASGVYILINSTTNKVYVGSSTNMRIRVNNHYKLLEKGIHPNKHLQSSYNLGYVFDCDYLEVTDKDQRVNVEVLWIASFKSYTRENGYNIIKNPQMVVMSEETKELLRNKRLGTTLPRHVVEAIRLKNTGQIRKGQKEKMKSRWDITKTYLGYSYLSEEQKDAIKQKISSVHRKRYLDDNNIANNTYIKATLRDNVYYFRSCVKASEFLKVDKATVKNNLGGSIKKLNCILQEISKEEFVKNKVVGER